ncbi:MAG TPA: UDP-N-acetylmuramoyl-tripeptide--D-alanyl-D-alanine ligase, partial [Bacillales bacterium]|nr:UDP-N-acetylmuramoyl-tripeptide--D-alanyl-D-alanine ligase [Bacillales bacterium]
YRNLFQIPVIGVTGTCGKTTTKEMIKQILEEDFNVEATWASMNSMSVNLRYLLDIDDETEMAVYEMPVCYPGYLQVACRYFQPQVRILLNIGVHHLADCDTPEAYMKAKAEMVDGLDSDHGILILNADDENIKKVVNITPFQNVIYFGKNEFSHFRAENIQYAEKGMNFNLKHNEQCYKVFIPGFGEHNVYNALAALAAVTSVGMDIETAIQRLVNFEHVEEHLEFKSGFNGCLVIDDTWNSSPLSMETGLQVLNDVSDQKFSIALLGYMPQLGEGVYAEQEYGKIGEKAVEYDLDLLFVVGKEAEKIGQRALEKGMDKNKVFFCETGAEIFKILKPYLNDQTIVLLKITHRVMKRPSFKALKRELIPDDDD